MSQTVCFSFLYSTVYIVRRYRNKKIVLWVNSSLTICMFDDIFYNYLLVDNIYLLNVTIHLCSGQPS